MTGGNMSELFNKLSNIDNSESASKQQIVGDIKNSIESSGYKIVELDDQRPWGAYFKFDNNEADRFIKEFFPDLSLSDARLGNDNAEISPKVLLVSPRQRLSWQYHKRRAERWGFLTDGAYEKSLTDKESDVQVAHAGDSVQISKEERHRLIGCATMYTLAVEIWQHTDSSQPSDENDNFRLQDDYNR